MAEETVPIKTFLRVYLCDECGGEMERASNRAYASSPMKYDYTCINGHYIMLTKRYPYVDWVREDG